MVSLDAEVIKSLTDINASGLINELLIKHFNIQDPRFMSNDELSKKIKLLELDEEKKKVLNE